ncbi:MAG: Ldh family oxidoreductase [Desulfobacterales bacterium]|nr:MAG: Ldh family oxidoreductase [Desulfobacterales bacterium]
MALKRYAAKDLIEFGKDVLVQAGFPEKQAHAASMILVEADLRGDHAHGIAGGNTLPDYIAKIFDDEAEVGFRRIDIADYSLDKQKYPTIISVDAHGGLGQYAALEVIPILIETAKKYGYAKAYIRNSNHFGDCGINSERIANQDLAAKVTCTSPPWTKPFIELSDKENKDSPANQSRYKGVKKRFGTNPIAWSIPYQGGIITIDMAATQRAVSPALEVARYNSQALKIKRSQDGIFYLRCNDTEVKLSDVHLSVAKCRSQEEVLKKLGVKASIKLYPVEEGLLKGPEGETIRFPLAFDEVFKGKFWVAPLGGTYFGYKGFGLNMLIELDNVVGGGAPGLLRLLDDHGKSTTTERVSQTLEAYAIDVICPLKVAKENLRRSVETTLQCGNRLMYLPGQKEQEKRKDYLAHGIPMTAERVQLLKKTGADPRINIPFSPAPV